MALTWENRDRERAAVNAYTAAQVEAVMGIPPATLRGWAKRGHVTKVGRDLYDGDSVIARWREVEAATDARLRDHEAVIAACR